MSPPNTLNSLRRELCELGLSAGMTVMVHSSLGQVGWDEWARGYAIDQRMSGAKARRELGWSPRHTDPIADIS
jgi:aminoglycoside N3'-acetyltransferase